MVQVKTRSVPRRLPIRSVFEKHSRARSARECAVAAAEIASFLRQQLPAQWLVEGSEAFNFELARLVEGFEAITPTAFPSDPPDLALDELNEQLASLLDWADDMEIQMVP
ncbi:hypothetical protein [Pseudomonas mosselii]|uniref:hypothetical protein n=1 Tax=Pseudomonas mosselii TaxID=78327 RepID=UPI0021D972DB|nr:hypothetical protein [Pseudomonas mosselii]MCU9529340.1 hypothetical protein [Pseudomonas mosselii]MCU9536631.1 hypothetical protein [Pseudomonas mosselii]MCU9542251.1 hypothetical protein [Pseudomonas mosselii]MCU9548356.1 hypothetical protein [Pseudomonas mosselii]